MRRRRREHSLLLKASKILVSLGASVNLTLRHQRRALRSFPIRRRGAAGSAAPAARNADATSPRREIGVGISPQVEPGVSADEDSKHGDDIAAGLATAHQVVEFTFTSGRQSAVPLETRGAVAGFDAATGRVTLSASTQMPHLLRTGIADALGIPEAELRVIAPEVGGGFGQKMALIPEYVVAVWAARRFACTVAWVEDRLENLTASFHARDQCLRLRVVELHSKDLYVRTSQKEDCSWPR